MPMPNPSSRQSGVSALAREELAPLLQRLPDRPMPAGMDTEPKKAAELAKESRLKETHQASWTLTLVGRGRNPKAERIGRLFAEAGEERLDNCHEEEAAPGGGGG